MTRLRIFPAVLATAAALAAGSAGATTIISGTNSVRVHQSPAGTVITHGPTAVTRSPIPLHRPMLGYRLAPLVPETVTREESGFARFFLFFLPWSHGVEGRAVIVPHEDEPRLLHRSIRAEPENRATDMMRSILRRMDR